MEKYVHFPTRDGHNVEKWMEQMKVKWGLIFSDSGQMNMSGAPICCFTYRKNLMMYGKRVGNLCIFHIGKYMGGKSTSETHIYIYSQNSLTSHAMQLMQCS